MHACACAGSLVNDSGSFLSEPVPSVPCGARPEIREKEEELQKKKQLEKDQPKCATDDWIKKMWYT